MTMVATPADFHGTPATPRVSRARTSANTPTRCSPSCGCARPSSGRSRPSGSTKPFGERQLVARRRSVPECSQRPTWVVAQCPLDATNDFRLIVLGNDHDGSQRRAVVVRFDLTVVRPAAGTFVFPVPTQLGGDYAARSASVRPRPDVHGRDDSNRVPHPIMLACERVPSRRCGGYPAAVAADEVGQVLQRVVEMLRAERRELDAPLSDELRHRRPVVGERGLRGARARWPRLEEGARRARRATRWRSDSTPQ